MAAAAKAKTEETVTAAKEHERLKVEALVAVDKASDLIEAAGHAYQRVCQEARAQGLKHPETIDIIGARAQRNPKLSGADLREGADPRMPFRRLMKVWNTRF